MAVGRGGRVFVTSLYLSGNVVTPHCPSDLVMITRADEKPEHPSAVHDVVVLSDQQLWLELSEASWERRSRAHQEILRRGGALLDEATRRLADIKENDRAFIHLIWLAGAGGKEEAGRSLTRLAEHSPADVRLQAVRALTEFPALKAPPDLFARTLDAADPRLRLAALAYFAESDADPAWPAVVKLAGSPDTYLRQSATRLLARRPSIRDLQRLMTSDEASTRLAGVLAAGVRLTVPPGGRRAAAAGPVVLSRE